MLDEASSIYSTNAQSREWLKGRPFRRLLEDLGSEHDRQQAQLWALVNDLQLELDKHKEGEGTAVLTLRTENAELRHKLLLAEAGIAINEEHDKPLALAKPSAARQPCKKPQASGCLDVHKSCIAKKAESQPVEPQPTEPPNCVSFNSSNGMVASSTVLQATAPAIRPAEVGRPSKRRNEAKLFRRGGVVLRRMGSGLTEHSETQARTIVESDRFEQIAGFLIIANTLCMMFETQLTGLDAGYITRYPGIEVPAEKSWPGAKVTFEVIERVFTIIFTIELLIRFAALRCRLCAQPLNWIDILAVFVGLMQWAVDTIPVNPVIVRLFRLGKLVRGIRFVKLTKVLDSLNLLIKCIKSSVSTLFWSLCLLAVVQCIVGMIACQLAQEYIKNLSNPADRRHELFEYYGTFFRSFVTMFEIHMANWATPCRLIMNTLGEEIGDIFVFYRCILGFSLMSVIGAVFVQQTMAVAQHDKDVMIQQRQKASERYASKLRELFSTLDENGDGMLSREEFDTMGTDARLKAWMNALDISPDDIERLFNLLDNGNGVISSDDFLLGAQRLKGPAKNIDMAQLIMVASRIEKNLELLNTNGETANEEVLPRLESLEMQVGSLLAQRERPSAHPSVPSMGSVFRPKVEMTL
mmetsp:Transcript_80700/g.159880  ORF Transcript_80700/g.159880 Transcript_80700/m.159880 type:complete len:638 (+) Transcript_80700:64-1977(+)